MKVVLFLLMCLAGGPAFAQCVFGSPPVGWPGQLTFQPANPVAGEPVTLVLGPETNYYIVDPVVSRAGNTITLSATLSTLDFLPPPPSIRTQLLGAFSAGSYTVDVRLAQEIIGPCAPMAASFIVGGAPVVDLPVLGTPMLVALVLALGAIVVPRLRRRTRAVDTR